MFFLQFGLGSASVQIVETRIFLRGTVMKASSHEKQKNMEKPKKQKVQTHGQGLGRGLAGDMGLNFCFFCFFGFSMVFCSLAKTSRKPKKTKKQKVQTHGQGLGRGLAGDMGLNFFFLVFPWFFAVWPKPRENKKKQKKPKSSDPWARSGERPGRGHGSELFVFFGFSMVFCSLAKTSRKTKKNKKFRPMGKVWGEAWQGTWV